MSGGTVYNSTATKFGELLRPKERTLCRVGRKAMAEAVASVAAEVQQDFGTSLDAAKKHAEVSLRQHLA